MKRIIAVILAGLMLVFGGALVAGSIQAENSGAVTGDFVYAEQSETEVLVVKTDAEQVWSYTKPAHYNIWDSPYMYRYRDHVAYRDINTGQIRYQDQYDRCWMNGQFCKLVNGGNHP